MVEREDWGFNPAWLEYVKKYHPGKFRADVVVDSQPERLAFLKRAEEEFSKRLNYSTIKTLTSIQNPVEGEGYDVAFPHRHYPDEGMALIHYLDPSDVPTPLHILEDGKVVEEITPYPGLTVYLENSVWHGVLKHKGSTPRIQLIALAIV